MDTRGTDWQLTLGGCCNSAVEGWCLLSWQVDVRGPEPVDMWDEARTVPLTYSAGDDPLLSPAPEHHQHTVNNYTSASMHLESEQNWPLFLRQTTSEPWRLSAGERGDYQNCSVLYCVMKLCTVISTLRWAVLTVLWIRFCLTGPISLCLDSFVFMFVFFCVILSQCIYVLLS